MELKITEESPEHLNEYGVIPIAFSVHSELCVVPEQGGLGGLLLVEKPVIPYIKDYDACSGGPSGWSERWDMAGWGVLSAFERGQRVGGAVIAHMEPELVLTGEQNTTAVLWDLRVMQAHRGKGVGRQLFRRAIIWAREHHCLRVEIETQNVNVPACRFYAAEGCELICIRKCAYLKLPNETQLIWQKRL